MTLWAGIAIGSAVTLIGCAISFILGYHLGCTDAEASASHRTERRFLT